MSDSQLSDMGAALAAPKFPTPRQLSNEEANASGCGFRICWSHQPLHIC